MLNPRDIEMMDDPEGRKNLPKEFLEEMENNKGDDDDDKKEGK